MSVTGSGARYCRLWAQFKGNKIHVVCWTGNQHVCEIVWAQADGKDGYKPSVMAACLQKLVKMCLLKSNN